MKNCEKYRAGNFLFVKEKRGGFEYITCSTLTKDWHIRIREDIVLFSVINALVDTKETGKLAQWATLMYGHSVMLHSADYYALVSKALVDDVNKAAADVPDITKEQDDALLQEVADIERKQGEMEQASKDNG